MHGILNYIFPYRCVNCERILNEGKVPMCIECFQKMPFTHWRFEEENPVFQLISKEVCIKNASSLLVYKPNSSVQKLIMANKYYNLPQIGDFLGNLAFEDLKNSHFEVITIVPSHHRTVRKRGYNQVEKFAKTISEKLEIPFLPSLLKRVKRRDSQTHKNREERYSSLKNTFQVSDEIMQYNSVLLLDDVLTTGSTLVHCCKAMLENKKLDISIYTMAKVG